MKALGLLGAFLAIVGIVPIILAEFGVVLVDVAWIDWVWYALVVVGAVCIKYVLDDYNTNKE